MTTILVGLIGWLRRFAAGADALERRKNEILSAHCEDAMGTWKGM